MQEHRVVVSRVITSRRFAPVIEKSIRERIEDFAEVRQLLSIYPFSADYSVKAAMGGSKRTGGNRNAAADNKAKRQKELNFKRLGIYCYDPKATKKPNQYFETKPRFNLDGQMGDVANVGWLDIPKTVKPENYNKQAAAFFASKRNEPKIIAKPAKMNKRTGQIEVKALGRTIGNAAGNIGQAAARAIGIVLDADGRMRCPPGVPAANQFTDEVGSNCFDFTPAVGRAVMEIVRRANQSILQDVNAIDAALTIVRDEDGSISEAPAETLGRMRSGLASSTRTIRGPRGELLGPDGMPISIPGEVRPPEFISPEFERDVAEIVERSIPITPDRYEEVFGGMIRRTYPELSLSEVKRLTKQAVQRQKLKDKQRTDIREMLDFAAELGVEIDPTDGDSVQIGLAKVLQLLKDPENGGWGVDLQNYFGSGFKKDNIDAAIAGHKAEQMKLVLAYLMENPQKFGLTREEFSAIVATKFGSDMARMQREMFEVLSGGKTMDDAFGSDTQMRGLLVSVMQKHDQMRMQEAGLLIGLINQRRKYPKLTDELKTIGILDPWDSRRGTSDAVTFATESGGYEIALNPLRTVMQTDDYSGKQISEYMLFEPDGAAGTEVAKLAAITSSLDAVGAKRAKDAYLGELRSLDAMQSAVERGDQFQQFFLWDNMGQVGTGMNIMNHEMTHARQIILVKNYLQSIPGMESMPTEELMPLVEGMIAGTRTMPSVFGNDWDYASIISNPQWMSTAMSNMPEIMQVLLGKNMGGEYAMNHYWEAAHRSPFLSDLIKTTDDLYKPLYELRQKLETLDPNSTEFRAGINVFQSMRQIYETGDMDLMQKQIAVFRQQSALTIAEMQAEVAAGVESGLIDVTPEIEAFLGPLAAGKDIPSDYGIVNPDAKPVVSDFGAIVKDKIKSTVTLRKQRQRLKAQREAERLPDEISPLTFTPEEMAGMPDLDIAGLEGADKETVGRILEALRGFRSRTDVSTTNNLTRESVLDAATTQQKQILDGDWQNSLWNTSDPTDWGRALRSRTDEVVNAVENQFIPFMDLVNSSEVPTDTVAEIHLPSRTLGIPGEEKRTILGIDKHFTAVIHSRDDLSTSPVPEAERLLLLVPEGSTGLPNYTPGTQRGEVGSLILPPGEIEIIGKTNDGIAIGKVSSQKKPEQQLNELRQVLHSLGTNESRPLGQQIVAKRAENRVERRMEAARVGRAQAAVLMEVDPKNSRLAEKIEYDPQKRTLKVSYKNGLVKEFEDVPYGKIRDVNASNKPDDLIFELSQISTTDSTNPRKSRSAGLASSTSKPEQKPQYPRKPSYGPILDGMNDVFEGVKNWEEFKKRYEDQEIVFIDYETTGLKFDEWNFSEGNGKVTQIGAVKVKNGKVIDRFETYVNPGIPSDEWEDWSRNNLKDYDGNLVTDEFLADKPSVAEAHKKFVEFAGPNALMGVQNAAFDKDVLEDALKEHGIDWKTRGWIDLKDMASMTLPRWSEENPDGPFRFDKKKGVNVPSNSLKDITTYLGVDLGDKHHTADADAEATAESMKRLIDKAIENNWSTDVLDSKKRTEYVDKQQKRFDTQIAEFETARSEYLKRTRDSEQSGLASSTVRQMPSERTTGQKIDQGPLELPNGRDNLGLPVVASTESQKRKFGTSRRQISRYFKKKYGVDVEISKSAMDEKKHPEFQAAGYAALQAIDDLLINVPGLKEILKDNKFSINVTDGGIEGRSPLFAPTGVLGTFGPRPRLFKTQKFGEGDKQKTRIDVNMHEIKEVTKKLINYDWVNYYPGLYEGQFGGNETGFIPRGNTTGGMFQIIGLPKFDDSYTVQEVGDDGKPVPPWKRRGNSQLDKDKVQKLTNELNGRLAYSVMVHEFGHLLDFSERDKSQQQVKLPSYFKAWWTTMTDNGAMGESVKERAKRMGEKLFGGDPDSLYESAMRADEIGRGEAPTAYGATKPTEALAEAFAAWFLFARAPQIRTTPARRRTSRNVRGEEESVVEKVNTNPRPMDIAAGILAPLIEKLGPKVKSANKDNSTEIEDLDPLVVLYTMLPLLVKNVTSDKIGRRRARRISQSKNDDKESV